MYQITNMHLYLVMYCTGSTPASSESEAERAKRERLERQQQRQKELREKREARKAGAGAMKLGVKKTAEPDFFS